MLLLNIFSIFWFIIVLLANIPPITNENCDLNNNINAFIKRLSNSFIEITKIFFSIINAKIYKRKDTTITILYSYFSIISNIFFDNITNKIYVWTNQKAPT